MEKSNKQKRMEVLQKLRETVRHVKETLGKGKLKPEVNNNMATAHRGSSSKSEYVKNIKSVKDIMATSTLNIYHCNVRSIGNKKKSIDEIIRANNIDICFLSELNNQCVPLFKGYHQFTRYDKRRFHGMTAIVANHLKGSVMRIPDESELEIVAFLLYDNFITRFVQELDLFHDLL